MKTAKTMHSEKSKTTIIFNTLNKFDCDTRVIGSPFMPYENASYQWRTQGGGGGVQTPSINEWLINFNRSYYH